MPSERRAVFGGEEGVDGGKAVGEPVGEAGAEQRVRRAVAELHHAGGDGRVLHHGAVVVEAHRRHVALAVAGLLVALEQRELLGGGAGGELGAADVGVDAFELPLGAVQFEVRRLHADRDAGVAAGADGRIGDVVAAAEAGARQAVVQRLGVGAGQLGDDLPLRPACEVGAGQRRGGVEELRPAVGAVEHPARQSRGAADGNQPPRRGCGSSRQEAEAAALALRGAAERPRCRRPARPAAGRPNGRRAGGRTGRWR